jgi:hypothetical protein
VNVTINRRDPETLFRQTKTHSANIVRYHHDYFLPPLQLPPNAPPPPAPNAPDPLAAPSASPNPEPAGAAAAGSPGVSPLTGLDEV